MGSVASPGFSLSSMLQTLTSANSPQLSAVLSSPTVETALQNASSGDVVELSQEALQLQEASQLFGGASTANTADPLSSLLSTSSNGTAAATSGAAGSSSASLSATAPPTNQLSGYQSNLQSAEMQALFGIASTGAPNPLLNTLG